MSWIPRALWRTIFGLYVSSFDCSYSFRMFSKLLSKSLAFWISKRFDNDIPKTANRYVLVILVREFSVPGFIFISIGQRHIPLLHIIVIEYPLQIRPCHHNRMKPVTPPEIKRQKLEHISLSAEKRGSFHTLHVRCACT